MRLRFSWLSRRLFSMASMDVLARALKGAIQVRR